jgi:hypothetical protein
METKCFSEISVVFQWTTRRFIPEDRLLIITAVRTSNPMKINLFLKTYVEVEAKLHAFLNFALDRSKLPHSCHQFYSRGKSPGTHFIGVCMGHRPNLDVVGKKEIICPCWE